MKTINRASLISYLRSLQDSIVRESDEDEAAAEYYAEIQSIIDVASDQNKGDGDIIKAASWVSQNISQFVGGA